MKKYLVHYCNQRAIVGNKDEAVKAIESFHTYNRKSYPILKVNDYVSRVLDDLFSDDPKGYVENNGREASYNLWRICTSGCGAEAISFYDSLADTLEEHQRIYKERCEAEKQERIRIAKEAREKRLAEWNEQKRGWYYVDYENFQCLTAYANFCYRSWSGTCIADSKLDAACKALKQIDSDLAGKGLQLAQALDALDAQVEFLGMKTDEGFSVKAWEDFTNSEVHTD